jgi:hydrogenase/urease accessory protein HupE
LLLAAGNDFTAVCKGGKRARYFESCWRFGSGFMHPIMIRDHVSAMVVDLWGAFLDYPAISGFCQSFFRW